MLYLTFDFLEKERFCCLNGNVKRTFFQALSLEHHRTISIERNDKSVLAAHNDNGLHKTSGFSPPRLSRHDYNDFYGGNGFDDSEKVESADDCER